MTRKTVMVVVGTRPECIKLVPVIRRLRDSGWADAFVVSTGQHRDMVEQTLAGFDIRPDADLVLMQPDQSPGTFTGRALAALDMLLATRPADLVLVQGDTASAMAGALAAFYRRVPLGHVEAGLRSFDLDQPFPEELNRMVTTLAARLHFAPTERARDNLLREHVPPERIHVTGNTVIDTLLSVARTAPPCPFPTKAGRRLLLVTAHRRESFGAPLAAICAALKALVTAREDIEIVFPVHPNPNVQEVVVPALGALERVHLTAPAAYADLVSLIKSAAIILTDSGGIVEEAPALGKPVLVLRSLTERPEAIESGSALLVGSDTSLIIRSVNALLDDKVLYAAMSRPNLPFGDGGASARIVEICRLHLAREAGAGLMD